MLRRNELKIALMELETESLGTEVYRYRTKCGVSVVYYIFDPDLIDECIFEPVYLKPEDVECEGMSEEEIFQAVLESTVTLMQTEIIPFSQYFREFEKGCEDKRKILIIRGIARAMDCAKEDRRVWCVTGSFRERCASGALCQPILRKFCEMRGYSGALIGFSDNDFAYLCKYKSENVSMLLSLVNEISHVVEDAEELTEKKVLKYDYETDTLSDITAV